MAAHIRSCLLSLLAVAGLAACTSLPPHRVELPISGESCLYSFAAGYEVRASLGVHTFGRKKNYLLALRTESNGFDLAIMTPQGVPVYSISCTENGINISRLTGQPEELPPQLLLSYLEIIFLDGDRLQQMLQPGWDLEEADNLRLLSQHSKDGAGLGEISIVYMGEPPWFTSVKIEDHQHEAALGLKIIESSLVLPE
jgi:uncharacterized protein DUF3261